MVPKLFRPGTAPDGVKAFIRDVRAAGKAPLDLLIIHHLTDAGMGSDENSNSDAGKVAVALSLIQKELDCAVLVIHHCGKAGDTYRGASAYRGMMDCMILLTGFECGGSMSCYK